MDKLMLTAEEVADMLGVARFTVWDWTKKGRIPHVRINNHSVRYFPDDVMEFLKKNRREVA